MQIQISKRISDIEYRFHINEADEIEALSKAGFLASMPSECKNCGSDRVHLSGNKAKGYTFVKVICDKCDARSQLGQYKDGGFFWKAWELYRSPKDGGQKASESVKMKSGAPQTAQGEDIDPEYDVPF